MNINIITEKDQETGRLLGIRQFDDRMVSKPEKEDQRVLRSCERTGRWGRFRIEFAHPLGRFDIVSGLEIEKEGYDLC